MVRPVLDPGIAARIRTTGAQHRTLPVAGELVDVIGSTIQRGLTVAVAGAPASAVGVSLQLAAGPSGAGSWIAAVGLPDLGLVAAHEAGIDLERFALIPRPDRSWADVVAALVDGFDMVLARPTAQLKAGVARRLVARARERGTVLVGVGGWPEGASLRIEVTSARWEGLEPSPSEAGPRSGIGMGAGHLNRIHRHLLPTGRKLAGVRSA